MILNKIIHVHTCCASLNAYRVTSYLAGMSAVVLPVTAYSMMTSLLAVWTRGRVWGVYLDAYP